MTPFAATFFRGAAGLCGAETRLAGGWGSRGHPPANFSAKSDGALRTVDRGVTSARGGRASPICPRAKRRRYFAERARGADLVLGGGTGAGCTTVFPCLGARIRGCCKQGCAASNLREVARAHAWPFCAKPTRPPRRRDESTMRRTPRDTSKEVRARRPLFFVAVSPTGPRLPPLCSRPRVRSFLFFEHGFSLPPAVFSSLPAIFSFLSAPPRPRFPPFRPRNVGRGFLFCVRSSQGAAAVLCGFESQRRGISGKRGTFSARARRASLCCQTLPVSGRRLCYRSVCGVRTFWPWWPTR